MSTASKAIMLAAASVMLSAIAAHAVVDGIKPAKIRIINPSNPAGRKVLMLARESGSDDTSPANASERPDQNGAFVDVTVTDSVNSSQTFALPSGFNWTRIDSIGWKYSDPTGANSPVRTLIMKKSGAGVFVAKVVAQNPGLDILPPQDTSPIQVVVRIDIVAGNDYCVVFDSSSNVVRDDATLYLARGGTEQGCPPEPTSTTTTSSTTSTATSTSTTSTMATACCGPERIQLVSGVGTLRTDSLVPFFFPAGVQTTLDTAVSDDGVPGCHHDVVIPAGGFTVPHFDVPALNYCSEITALGCASGGNDGKGNLWDGHGTTPAITNVSKQADTSDGVCGTLGSSCSTTPGGAGANTLGKVVTTRSASTPSGIRSLLDIPVDVLTWADSQCKPAFTPGCCAAASYGDDTVANSEILVTEYHVIISPTTNVATGAFVDLNSDGCKRAGAGFAPPGVDGPKSSTGTPAPGPCCTGGQSATLVWVGVGFSGGAPLYDVGYQITSPNTVTGCAVPAGGTCVLTTDPCLGSPSGAFLDPLL